ncbi:MAG TPA: DNA translocase FtsK [Candidatus Paceibacterota bacterium]
MGRNKKEKVEDGIVSKVNLREETTGWMIAICFFTLTLFFILASIHKAGFVGDRVFSLFDYLFGVGYFLLPILFLIQGGAYAKARVKPIGKTQIIAAVVFFISSLSLINLGLSGKGGVVGNLFSTPLLKLFDIYATSIILVAISVASLIAMLDFAFSLSEIFSFLFKKKNAEEGASKDKDEPLKLSKESLAAIRPDDKAQSDMKLEKPLQPMKTVGDKEFGELGLNSKTYSKGAFSPPPLSLLEKDRGKPGVGDIKANANIIKRTLQNFGIVVEMDEISIGPSVTRYTLKPAEGVKLSKILGLQNNLELALAAHPVRIEAPIPGKSLVGIEIPNSAKTTVGLGSLLSEPTYQDSEKPLLIALGKSISGLGYFDNTAKMPHLLIAGATGSGKSVTIHVLINSLLFRNTPDNLKFIMIDPKRVELTLYNKIPHLLTPVITDAKKAIMALKWAAKEMDRRYDILEKSKVRDIASYHKNIEGGETMPYIVVIIDELADIMQAYPRELESAIVRLAQMSRAVGIHLILSTQRPSVNVITGLIKANIPSRIALQVASQIDSRTILDAAGAEKLLGAGDMLYLSGEMSKPIRLQSPYISETEVKNVVEYLAKQYEDELPGEIDMEAAKKADAVFSSTIGSDADGDDEDDLYSEAKEIVIQAGKASTSYLQRKLRVGYARAARLMDILEERGVIGPGEGAKPRDVLIKPEGTLPENTEFPTEETANEKQN